MAIDSAQKRFSIMRNGLPWERGLSVANADIDGGDRLELLALYSGILAAEVELAEGVPAGGWIVFWWDET